MKRPFEVLLTILLLAAGVGFRFYGLGVQDKLLWHDEVYTQLFAAGAQAREWRAAIYTGEPLPVGVIQALMRDRPERSVVDTALGLAADEPQHPPLYYMLARLTVSCFGDDIATLRALSAALSLAAFPSLFWLCMELFRSRRIAWTSLGLFAVSPFFVLYAQEAREYALWSVLILLSNAALLRAMRLSAASTESPPATIARAAGARALTQERMAWSTYALLTTLALYTSFASVSFLLAHALFVALKTRLRITRMSVRAALALGLAGGLFLPWAILLLKNLDAFLVSMAWSRIISIPHSELFTTLAWNASRTILDLPESANVASGIAVSSAAVLIFGAFYALCRRPRQDEAHWFAILLFGVPILMLLIPDALFGGIRSISGRYLTPAWLAAVCALAFLLGSNALRPTRRSMLHATIVLTGLASCYMNSQRFVVWSKGVSSGLPAAAARINQRPSPLVVGNFERHHPGNLLALSYLLRPDAELQFLPEHDSYALPQGRPHVFLYSPIREFRRALEKNYEVDTRLLAHDLYFELWEVIPPAARRR